MNDIFSIERLTFYYPEQTAGHWLDLRVARGEFLVLCVPPGAESPMPLRQLKTVLALPRAPEGQILRGRRWMAWTSGPRASGSDSCCKARKPSGDGQGMARTGLRSGEPGYDTPTIRRRVAEMAFLVVSRLTL
ncbi:MAG: hypothetical protein ACLSAF_22000 [Intestinimonas sp.]